MRPCRPSPRRRCRRSAARSGSARGCRRPSASPARRSRPRTAPKRAPAGRARRHDQLRHADRQRLHRGRAQQRALGAAEAEHAVRAGPRRTGARTTARTPSQHQRHGRAARAGGADVVERRSPPRAATSSRGDVGRDQSARRGCRSRSRRRPRRAPQPVAHVGDLVALRVEGADQRDRGHQTAGAALAASAARRRSIESCDVAVVVVPRARRRCRGRAGTSPCRRRRRPRRRRRSRCARRRRAVDGGDELDRQVAVVADPPQLARRSRPSRARRARAACGCCRRRGSRRGGRPRRGSRPSRSASSMFMWNTSRQTPQSPPTVLGQRERLLAAVQEVGLEAVERLEADPDADRLGVRLALLEASTAQRHSSLGRAPSATILPTVDGHDREDLAAELGDERQAVLDVLRRCRRRTYWSSCSRSRPPIISVTAPQHSSPCSSSSPRTCVGVVELAARPRSRSRRSRSAPSRSIVSRSAPAASSCASTP